MTDFGKIDLTRKVVVCMSDASAMQHMQDRAAYECPRCRYRVGYRDVLDGTTVGSVVMTRDEAQQAGVAQ